MSFLSRFSLKNPIAVLILVLLISFGGVYSASKFKQESLPDISIPFMFVTAVYPGATPQEVQNEVAIPLEKALKNIEGLDSLESTSANNIAVMHMKFGFDVDLKEKQREIEEALNTVVLPSAVERPKVNRISLEGGPMMYASISAEKGTSEAELRELIQNKIKPALQGVEGVGKVDTYGLQSENVYIKLDAAKMAERKVSFQQVSQVLQAMNLNLPVGEATFNKITEPVQVVGRAKTVDELKNLVITPMPEVKLQDIATVSKGQEKADTLTRVQGQPSIAINITKNSDANSVDVSNGVRKELDEQLKDNDNVQLDYIYDSANEVKKSVNGMVREGILGALFASILILIFLRNFRATLIAIVSIPLSVFVALTLLKYFTDITLNIMTLGGLAVAVGRVVDDSIVVIENIVRRIQNQKVTKELVLDATKEVGNAITSSTITTVAVFAPLALVSGLIGKIFAPFAWTVVLSILASLLVAVTVVPLMAYLLLRRHVPKEHKESKLSRKYKNLLTWSLNHKASVLLLSVLLLGGTVPLAMISGYTFIPEQSEKYLLMNLTMPKGTDTSATDEKAREIDDKLRDTGKVKLSQVTSGSPKGEFNPMTMSAGQSNKAMWIVSLEADEKMDVTSFIKDMKKKLSPKVEGATLDIQEIVGGPTGPNIYVIVTGDSISEVRTATTKITDAIKKVEGTDSVKNSLSEETKSVEVKVRPTDALRNGLTTAQVSGIIRPFFTEQNIGKMGDGMNTDKIYLSLTSASLNKVTDIENMLIPTATGQMVPLKAVADVKEVSSAATLQLHEGQEFASVTGNITDSNTGKVNANLKKALDDLDLPDGVSYTLDGSNKQINDMFSDMGLAILVAIGMVYVVMVVAFGEGKAPFSILFSLPFAAIGGLAGTVIAKQPISVASMIGMLMLIGIVVTNAIVLVDRVQQQMENGQTIRESLLEAGGTRLRPILMTAIATICALLPLALGMGEGQLISQGLAVVVIGGLVTSTMLTLVIVPVMFELMHARRVRKELRRTKRSEREYPVPSY